MMVRRFAARWRRLLVVCCLFASMLAPAAAGAATLEDDGQVHMGLYTDDFSATPDLDGVAAAAGERATFGGTFHHLAENDGVQTQTWSNTREILESVWQGEATPFANVGLPPGVSLAQIAGGGYDAKIHEWASHVEQYLAISDAGPRRNLIIAPFPEENYQDSATVCSSPSFRAAFRGAYRRLVDIFRSRGLDETQVRWAFAPNGYTNPGCGTLADYYPGDGYVDVLAFSGYNFGTCVGTGWESVQQATGGPIAELRAIGPYKPIVVAQTAAPRVGCGGDQSQWVRDLVSYLSTQPNVVGFVWFNFVKETDWRVWTGSSLTQGWRDAASWSTTSYRWPLTSWFARGPLQIDPPLPPCPQGADCDSVALVTGGGQWHIRQAIDPAAAVNTFFFGNPGDAAFVGDWDCDGIATPGLYRRSDGYVYLRNSNTQGVADVEFFFGDPGDLPLVGDFDGDGCDTVSIYRPSQGRVFIVDELGEDKGGLGAARFDFYFGNPGDTPFVGDFDGDGVDTVGLHRASTGFVYFRDSLTSGVADRSFFFGDPGDVIMAGDWDGDGDDTVGVFRPATGTVYLNYENAPGAADYQLHVGSFVAAADGAF